MGIGDALKGVQQVELPSPKKIIGGYKEARQSVKRVDVNTINVRFYPANSPFFHVTKGELYHFTTITVLKIEVPEKIAFLVQDDSIYFDKGTKEEWIDCRQDYPLTMAVNKQLEQILKEAMAAFPDIDEWFIPSSINKVPVRNVILKHDLNAQQELKNTIAGTISQNIVEWMDQIPAEVTITPKFLYDFMDIQVIGSLKNDDSKFSWSVFIMGGLFFSILTIMFTLYIQR